jgi:hypothetical protein
VGKAVGSRPVDAGFSESAGGWGRRQEGWWKMQDASDTWLQVLLLVRCQALVVAGLRQVT